MIFKAVTNSSVTVHWQQPTTPNGIVVGYRIYYMHDNFTDVQTVRHTEPNMFHLLKGLSTYLFKYLCIFRFCRVKASFRDFERSSWERLFLRSMNIILFSKNAYFLLQDNGRGSRLCFKGTWFSRLVTVALTRYVSVSVAPFEKLSFLVKNFSFTSRILQFNKKSPCRKASFQEN